MDSACCKCVEAAPPETDRAGLACMLAPAAGLCMSQRAWPAASCLVQGSRLFAQRRQTAAMGTSRCMKKGPLEGSLTRSMGACCGTHYKKHGGQLVQDRNFNSASRTGWRLEVAFGVWVGPWSLCMEAQGADNAGEVFGVQALGHVWGAVTGAKVTAPYRVGSVGMQHTS
eukprot:1161665-Pelagomonas_calceolata.AAC.5